MTREDYSYSNVHHCAVCQKSDVNSTAHWHTKTSRYHVSCQTTSRSDQIATILQFEITKKDHKSKGIHYKPISKSNIYIFTYFSESRRLLVSVQYSRNTGNSLMQLQRGEIWGKRKADDNRIWTGYTMLCYQQALRLRQLLYSWYRSRIKYVGIFICYNNNTTKHDLYRPYHDKDKLKTYNDIIKDYREKLIWNICLK